MKDGWLVACVLLSNNESAVLNVSMFKYAGILAASIDSPSPE